MSGADRRMTWADFMKQAHERPLPREILEHVARMEDETPGDDEDAPPSDTC